MNGIYFTISVSPVLIQQVCLFYSLLKSRLQSALLNSGSGTTITFCPQPVVRLDNSRLTHVCQLDGTCDLVALQPILEVFTSHPAPSVSASVLCVCLSFQVHMRDFCVCSGTGPTKQYCVIYLNWIVPCWKPTVTVLDDYFNSVYIVLSGSVSHSNYCSWLLSMYFWSLFFHLLWVWDWHKIAA